MVWNRMPSGLHCRRGDLALLGGLKGEMCVGFIAVKIRYGRRDIYVMGILPEYQRRGIGQQLIEAAELYFRQKGCKYAIVKTLSDLAEMSTMSAPAGSTRRLGLNPLSPLQKCGMPTTSA